MQNKSIFYAICLMVFSLSVNAESGDTTISLDVGKDEQNNTNSLISADIGLSDKKRIFFGLGKSKIPSGNSTIESNFAFIGLSSNYNQDWKLSGTLESSGLKGAYTMFSTSAGIRYSQDNYFLEFAPAIRRISLTTLTKRNLIISSTAMGFKAGFYVGKHFRLSGNVYNYTYSADVSKLASFASTRFFNVKTLLLSSGLLKKSYNLETGLDYDSFSISFGKNRSISAIDNTSSDYIYSVLDYYFSDAWGVSLLFGKYLNTPSDQDNYTSVTVNYSY